MVMTPRPGRVAGEIRVTAPQVRTQEWRTTTEFAAIAREVSLTLRHAMYVGADIGSRI